ncbi:hypothetical protein [Planctomycetes bacterium K23_9]
MKLRQSVLWFIGGWLIVGAPQVSSAQAEPPDLTVLLRQFRDQCGADVVFRQQDLPPGKYHDVLKPLDESQKIRAVTVCIEEAKKYPRQFFAEVGLKKIGVFAACASKTTTDPSREFDQQLGGYRYFGVYNGTDAIAASFYSEGQLALTFHHETFHHVDSTVDGNTASWQLSSDDAFYQAAITQRRPYRAPPIPAEDLAMLRTKCIGFTLKDAVSQYAAKNSREDQAETARHLMSMLPNSLVQAIEQPELAGSQRILHVLNEYRQSVPDGPSFDWFVDVALERTASPMEFENTQELLDRFVEICDRVDNGDDILSSEPEVARAALRACIRLSPRPISQKQSSRLLALASEITVALLRERICPGQKLQRFDIWGAEDSAGVNHTLRHDVIQFGRDVQRLRWIAAIHAGNSSSDKIVVDALQSNLRLLAKYYVYIDSNFPMTVGTKQEFEDSRRLMVQSVSHDRVNLSGEWQSRSFAKIAQQDVGD